LITAITARRLDHEGPAKVPGHSVTCQGSIVSERIRRIVPNQRHAP
jgi:hypothetical protein